MKKIFLLCLGIGATLFTGSAIAQVNPQTQRDQPNGQQPKYLDIATGKPIDLRYNARDNMMYDRNTNKPVDFFLNGKGDTVSSRGFYIVNNYLIRDNDTYRLDTSKVSMKGQQMWGIQSDKELERDKSWKQYRNKKDSL